MQSTSAEVLPTGRLIGEAVRNPQGDDLGTVEELMIDMENGDIAYVVLAPVSELARENRLLAVPWGSLRRREGALFILDADMRRAPAFDRGSWPRMSDRSWGEEVHDYYGQVPYWQRRYFTDEPSEPTQKGGEKKPSSFQP